MYAARKKTAADLKRLVLSVFGQKKRNASIVSRLAFQYGADDFEPLRF